MTSVIDSASPAFPCILVYAGRERSRAFVRAAFPRRRCHTVLVRNLEEFEAAIRRELIDAVVVDLAAQGDAHWTLAARAVDFPSTPFFGLLPFRTTDAEAVAHAAALGFADVLCEQIDEASARDIIAPLSYSSRFARALSDAPDSLGFTSETQRKTWRAIVHHAGRPVTTTTLAAVMGVTREHLSRNFARDRGANLKRVIDLVRLISAAELSKNPGYDVRDVAAVLGFASSSHLAVTTQRIASTRPASLSGLRTIDLVDRFVQGRTRSRVAGKGGL
ncbi:MAG TPA: AraC family transcriptional regulator [Gemmatimonadaceae bacterium]|nr:AraC family transcriptional regulator [Gemmatimonadaceae bacterium]